MVYAILKSLAGLELIDGVWENGVYPPKAVYAATQEGDAEFQRWLRRPVSRMREVRFDFLVKLHFALDEDRELARQLLLAQASLCRDYASEVQQELSGTEPAGFDAIVLGSKVSAAELTERWLLETLETLGMSKASV